MTDQYDNALVIKANRLIQDFKYKLSKSEMRVVNLIISNIDSPLYDEEFNLMQFNINDFYKLLGWDDLGGSDYNRLKTILKKLSNNSSDYIQIGEKETIVRWIEKPYFHKKKGVVELKLDDDLKPFLLKASGFIKAKLKYYFEMDSKYSMRIYELMKSWEGCGRKEFEIDDFRSQIDAEQKSYENFGKFHQGVLRPSVEEINKVTDLELSYETITSGKKVTHIIFQIKKSNKKQQTEQLPDNQQQTQQSSQVNTSEENSFFDKRYGIVAEAFPEFTKEQIEALYHMAVKWLDLTEIGANWDLRQIKIIDFISPKWAKIKATPEQTTSNPFNRLFDAVENNY